MNIRSLALTTFALVASASSLAFADQKGDTHHHGFQRPQSYTEESTRTYADGKTVKRHVEQAASASGLTKTTTLTNKEGKAATRKITVSFDKENHTWSRSVQGINFDGKSYSSSSQGQSEGNMRGRFHHDRGLASE
jgi:hypothetical protein